MFSIVSNLLGLALFGGIFRAGLSSKCIPPSFVCERGHFRPNSSCTVSNVMLNPSLGEWSTTSRTKDNFNDDVFRVSKFNYSFEKHEVCLRHHADCNLYVSQEAVLFSVYYHYEHGNFYHFFYDTVMPLFSALSTYYTKQQSDGLMLLPFVEHGSLPGFAKGVDWKTRAFHTKSMVNGEVVVTTTVWTNILNVLFGKGNSLVPLDSTFSDKLNLRGNVCFGNVRFGLPKYNHTDTTFLNGFRHFVFLRLKLPPPLPVQDIVRQTGHHALFVKRINRRRVLNQEELIANIADILPTTIISFEGMPFREQVRLSTKCTVFIGMQGAGIMNAMYLPSGSAIVVLFQYMAASDSFSSMFAGRARPYLRWVNKDKNNSFVKNESMDPYHDNADTIVDLQAFRGVIEDALAKLKKMASLTENVDDL
jgi:EGF domain-specific O-GlcNAc transferase